MNQEEPVPLNPSTFVRGKDINDFELGSLHIRFEVKPYMIFQRTVLKKEWQTGTLRSYYCNSMPTQSPSRGLSQRRNHYFPD